jgi:two-component system OmpR family response regulator
MRKIRGKPLAANWSVRSDLIMSVGVIHIHEGPVALVVEEGSQIRKHVEDCFQKNHIHMVAWTGDLDADRIIHASRANMILLNSNLRDNKAFALCQKIKEKSRIAVVMVSAGFSEIEKIVSLEMGADDCLPIDFNPRQVVARIRSLFGRQCSNVTIGDQASGGGITLNRATRQVQIGREPAKSLSPAEYDLLNFLFENIGQTLTRDEIHSKVFSSTSLQFVDVMVCRVRKKIEHDHRKPKFLRTVRNLGYIMMIDI